MKTKISYSQFAVSAMHRASKMAKKKALENKLKIPVWKNGKVIYLDADKYLPDHSSPAQ